jgi:hypothetical protein
MKTCKVGAESRVGGIEIANDAEDEWIGPGNVEKPVVVGEKRATFNSDATEDAEGARESLKPGRECGFVEGGSIGGRPGHATGASGVEEVDVGIDDLVHAGDFDVA